MTTALVVAIAAGIAVVLAIGFLGWRTMSNDRAEADNSASSASAEAASYAWYRFVRLDPWPFPSGEVSQKATDCDRMRYMAQLDGSRLVSVEEADGLSSIYVPGLTAEDCGVVVDRSQKLQR